MVDASVLSSLSFFTVSRYHYEISEICDFRDAPRPHYCMGLILSGSAVFEFDGKSITVNPGEIIFIPVTSRYRSVWTGNPDITYISMHFFMTYTSLLNSRFLSIQKLSPTYDGEFRENFQKAFDSYGKDSEGQLAALGCFFSVMSKIYPKLVFGEERRRDERIERAAFYLETNYKENVSTQKLAELSHMSVSHFHTCFKSEYSMTPVEYKNHVKVRYAILELIKNQKSVEEISTDLGFESVTYFRRVFRKETGCAPTKYTKKHMEI